MRTCLIAVAAFSLAAPPAEDHFTAGSKWAGVMKWTHTPDRRKGERGPQHRSTDASLTVTARAEGSFTGAYQWDKEKNAVEISGTIDAKGAVKFTVTKELHGDLKNNLVANARFVGRLKAESLTGRFVVPGSGSPGNGASIGTISLKPADPEEPEFPQ